MADRIGTFDWAATPLGEISGWPEYLRALTNHILASPQVSTIACGPGRHLIYNDAAAALYGDRHPGALGQPLNEAFADSYPSVATLYDRAFAGETVEVSAQPLSIRAEEIFDATLCPVWGPDGEVAAVHMIGFEVGLRVAAERALRQSEEKYRLLFSAIDEGFCIVEVLFDSEGRPVDYRFLETNPVFERQTGLVDAVGKSMRALAPDHEERWFEIYGRIALTGEAKRFEDPAAALGRFFDVFAFRIGEPEQRRVAILFRDIGERKRAQDALRESEERQAFLLELSDALRPLADAAAIQAATTRMIGEHLAVDRAMYAEVEGPVGAEVGTICCQFIRPARAGEATAVPFPERFLFKPYGEHRMAARYRGDLLVVANIDDDPRADAAERAAWAAANVRSAIVAPLVKDGRLVAEFGVHCEEPRDWMEAEQSLIREVAERTWAAAERARAEAALTKSQARLQIAMTAADVGMWNWDISSDRLIVDERLADIFGLDPKIATTSGLPLETFMARMHPEDRLRVKQLIREATETGADYHVEHRIVNPDGSLKWVEARGKLQDDPLTRTRRFFGVIVDITKRKRAELALRASEERQAFLLILSDKLRAVVNAQEVQRAACRLLGEQLEADRVYYLENDTESGRGIVLNDYAVDGLPSLAGEYPHETFATTYRRLGDGQTWIVHDAAIETSIDEQEREYFLDQSVRAWIDVPLIKDGRLEAVLCVVQSDARAWIPADIALVEDVADRTWAAVERARVERALREEERLRTAMLDVLPLGLALTDTGGRVVLSNREWARFIPTKRIPSRDQDRGPRWRSWNEDGDLVEPQSFPAARALRGEHVDPPMEFLYVQDDGHERWTSVAAIPFRDSSDEIIGAVCVIQDIDAAKRASESLQDSERHAQVLLAELQHRVRNTLAVVRSIARRTADRTETQADFVSHFEGRLSAFSRVQAVVTRSPDSGVALRTLVEDELLALAARDGNHIKISGPDVCLTSRAAETISLAIHELATNAIKYGALSAPRGRVQVNWSCLDGGGKDDLRFEWRERGLDSRPAASREGFGHELLLRSLPYDLDAKTEIVFEEDGLRFLMTLPMTAEVIASGEQRSTQ